MRIGLPRELKDGEHRVALTPEEVRALAAAGHAVIFEPGAGAGAGFADDAYREAGAADGDPWQCDLVVKVKELQRAEYSRPRAGATVFAFQHFAPEPELLEAALASGATFVAYETVGEADGSLPLLAPMSAIAGRLAIQAGAWWLQKPNGGSGVLLCALEGVAAGRVAIVGAGHAGASALALAHAIGARASVFARSERRLAPLRARYPAMEFHAGTERLEEALRGADLVIGAVRAPAQRSPRLISRAMLRAMRPGSVLVDIGIDQGGIAETSRPTSHRAPTYVEEGVVHYCVPNMPAACPASASRALARALLPFVLEWTSGHLSPALASGIQVRAGHVVHEALARATGRRWHQR